MKEQQMEYEEKILTRCTGHAHAVCGNPFGICSNCGDYLWIPELC